MAKLAPTSVEHIFFESIQQFVAIRPKPASSPARRRSLTRAARMKNQHDLKAISTPPQSRFGRPLVTSDRGRIPDVGRAGQFGGPPLMIRTQSRGPSPLGRNFMFSSILVVAATVSASAQPPPGADPNSEMAKWFKSLKSNEGQPCCDVS